MHSFLTSSFDECISAVVGVTMGWKSLTLFLFLAISLGFAGFTEDTISAKCQDASFSAVYQCNGGVVKAVYANLGGGSVYFKPNGQTIQCPVVAPSAMSAECQQINLLPNYCPTLKCQPNQNQTAPPSANISTQEPSKNQTTNQTPSNPPSQVKNETTKNETVNPPSNQPSQPESPSTVPIVKTSVDNSLNWLVYVVAALGVAAVVVLFMLFKKSLAEEA